jgi:serine protease DegS
VKSVSFVLKASVLGLIIAAIIVLLWPAAEAPRETAPPEPDIAARSAPAPAATGPVSYAKAVDRASTSVVNVYTSKTVEGSGRGSSLLERFFGAPSRPRDRTQSGLGSGVVFNDQGNIVTNYHVVREAEDIHVSLSDGRHAPARLIGADPETDLAILEVELADLPPITLGRSEQVRVGDVVLAIGNPFGVGQTVTMGIVSATGRDRLGVNTFENFIQTDAAINPGNSGGALINANGELVGINTAIFSQSGGSDGIGFAIPADMVRSVLKQIIEHGRVVRGWLGVEAHNIPARLEQRIPVDGVLITGVMPDGPAQKAGLKPGDVITEINGQRIADTRTLLDIISGNRPGTELKFKLWRDGDTASLTATLAQRPAVRS